MNESYARIPKKALEAIQAAIAADAPVADLEYLGLSVRIINMLEESEFNIVRLEELMGVDPQELIAIENLGSVSVKKIFEALSKYDQLEEAKEEEDGQWMQGEKQ